MILRIVAAVAAVLWSGAADAQPSFDCARSSNAVERAICGSDKLAKADRELASLYGALAGKLSTAAKEHLLKDQVHWIESRSKACTGATEAVTRCLGSRYDARIATLKAMGEGPYPFVSEQTLLRAGKVKATRYEIDAAYPRFDGTTADFSAVNQAFAAAAQEGAKNATPGRDAPDRESTWTYQQTFSLHRPGPSSVSVATTFYSYTGGAHGSSGVIASLVDLRTGRSVPPSGVFLPTAPWERTITDLARADLKRQFVERPGFNESLEPDNFAKLMKDPDRYLFKEDALVLLFNQYDVAAYVMGPYTVTIPYGKLADLIRPDGPLAK
jgi:uncharacterized protein